MTKQQIKMLTAKQLTRLSTKWLLLIVAKNFGDVSNRARAELNRRNIRYTIVRKGV